MNKVKYKVQEAYKVLSDLTALYSLTPEVQELVSDDLMAGMSREDIKKYCAKRIPLLKMKIISECIRRDVPEEVMNRLTSRDKGNDTLELIYQLIIKNVEVGIIDQMAPDNDRLMECLDRYKEGYKAPEVELTETPEVSETAATNKSADINEPIDKAAKSEVTEKPETTQKVNVVRTVVDNKIVEMVKEKVSEEADKSETKGEAESNTKSEAVNNCDIKTDFKPVTEVVTETSTETKPENRVESGQVTKAPEIGMTREDFKSFISGLTTELVGGLISAYKDQEVERYNARRDELSERVQVLKEQIELRRIENTDRNNEISEMKKLVQELTDKVDQTTRSIDEKINQVSLEVSKCAKENDSCTKVDNSSAEIDNGTSKAVSGHTENISTSSETAEKTSAVKVPSEAEDDSSISKVVQFTDRNGGSSVITHVDFSRRRTSGLGALAASLGSKKRSRRSMMKMAISGELSKEQLTHIVSAIRAGLTEEQLCNLIENRVDADKMPQIIEIAVLENKMGYSA